VVTNSTFTRRTLLGTGTAAVAGAALLAAGCGGPSRQDRVDGFIDMSRVLTGVDDLPEALAPDYLDALGGAGLRMAPLDLTQAAGYVGGRGPATAEALMASSALSKPGAEQCARAIAGAWWSGMVTAAGHDTVLVTYDDALVFRAMRFARPQAQCLGATGAWSRPTPAALA